MAAEKGAQSKVVVLVRGATYDRWHQAGSIAAAATAMGRRADVFLFWEALEGWAKGAWVTPTFPARPALEERWESERFPTAHELIQAARDSGLCTLYACTGSSAILGLRPDTVTASVDHHVGWATILQVTQGVVDRFEL
jgi:peroxiredoxin family protein